MKVDDHRSAEIDVHMKVDSRRSVEIDVHMKVDSCPSEASSLTRVLPYIYATTDARARQTMDEVFKGMPVCRIAHMKGRRIL